MNRVQNKYLRYFLIWRLRHISDHHFVVILSVLTGLIAGLAAVVIKNITHFIEKGLLHYLSNTYQNYVFVIYPIIGIFITIIVIKYIIRHPINHGIPGVLYAISRNNGIIKRHNMFSSIITSALTVGFGGSVGLEGPTVVTGSAIGSNIARLFHLSYKQTYLLLACACASAIASIFKAPIAGVVLVIEILMIDLTMSSILPLLIASVVGTLTSYLLLGQDVVYHYELNAGFNIQNVPYYIVFGLIIGFLSHYFTKVYLFIGNIFEKINNPYKRLLIGGGLLGLLIFLFPSLYGEGYHEINYCLDGNLDFLFTKSLFYNMKGNIYVALILLFAVTLLKAVSASLTFGAGGIGGTFAPTLFMGATAGLLFATIINLLEIKNLPVSNFALAGMSGIIAGVMHAPLTGIFLIADITNGYNMFVPLIITSTISFATIKFFQTNSIYTIQLARRGDLITHDKDKSVLNLMRIDDLIETDFANVSPDATLGDLVKIIATSKRNIFPVVGNDNTFHGLVLLDSIRHIMFKPELYSEVFVCDLMNIPDHHVTPDDTMETVAQKFQVTGRFNIVVLKNGEYVGCVSRANVFSTYRKLLKQFSNE